MTTSNAEPSNEVILNELDKIAAYGVIDYVLPTVPLGESWVVGVRGNLVKMGTIEEVLAFLTGVNAALVWASDHVPAVAEALKD